MVRKTILLIEDDPAIRDGLDDALQHAGYEVLPCACGRDGGEQALRADYDLLLLDLTLPHRDGLDILEELRLARPTLPVILLTARGTEEDRVRGLQLGADDYVPKPFGIRELLARIEAVLRRSPERPDDVSRVAFTGGVADLPGRRIRHDDGTEEPLSEREASLLRYLASRRGTPVRRDAILAHVWGIDGTHLDTRTIDMHVVRLRGKLRDDRDAPHIIRTVRGVGYVFHGEDAP